MWFSGTWSWNEESLMIEINLSPTKKEINITKVAGIDLSLINVKFLVPFFLAIYLVEPAIDAMYLEDIQVAESKASELRKKDRQLRDELRSYEDVKRQVQELNIKEKALKAKISVVKQIVDKRQNPYSILSSIVSSIPEDVWLLELEIDDRNFKMIGYSKSWKSIGMFMNKMKVAGGSQDTFFENNINFTKPDGVPTEINGNRVEPFEITARIKAFYP